MCERATLCSWFYTSLHVFGFRNITTIPYSMGLSASINCFSFFLWPHNAHVWAIFIAINYRQYSICSMMADRDFFVVFFSRQQNNYNNISEQDLSRIPVLNLSLFAHFYPFAASTSYWLMLLRTVCAHATNRFLCIATTDACVHIHVRRIEGLGYG